MEEGLRGYTWELFKKIARAYDVAIVSMEIADDHVHLLVDIPPKRSVAEIVRVVKSLSAREMFEKFPGLKKRLYGGEIWRDGYFVRSVGSEVTGAMVKKYIDCHREKEGNPAQLRIALPGKPKRA